MVPSIKYSAGKTHNWHVEGDSGGVSAKSQEPPPKTSNGCTTTKTPTNQQTFADKDTSPAASRIHSVPNKLSGGTYRLRRVRIILRKLSPCLSSSLTRLQADRLSLTWIQILWETQFCCCHHSSSKTDLLETSNSKPSNAAMVCIASMNAILRCRILQKANLFDRVNQGKST